MTPERERFEELLPFYVNGTLEGDDLVFVKRYLETDQQAQQSLAITTGLKEMVGGLAAQEPNSQQLESFLNKWQQRQSARVSAGVPTAARATGNRPSDGGLKGWWLAFVGVGAAALVATMVAMPGLLPKGLLHLDQLDGQADLTLVLSPNLTPDDEVVVAHLERFGAQVVAYNEQEGGHRISVDLQNRAANQHAVIEAMQSAGHLQDYALVAER